MNRCSLFQVLSMSSHLEHFATARCPAICRVLRLRAATAQRSRCLCPSDPRPERELCRLCPCRLRLLRSLCYCLKRRRSMFHPSLCSSTVFRLSYPSTPCQRI